MTVELIYETGCPNVAAARRNLARALAAAGLPIEWTEWVRDDAAAPERVRRFGSPTILVNQRDVAGSDAEDGPACHIYGGTGEERGAPPVSVIVLALQRAGAQTPQRGGARLRLARHSAR